MEMITEKQYNYIYCILGKEITEIEQLKQITKYEASKIILRNIVEHRPYLQWYIWIYKDKAYANTTRYFNFNKILKKYNEDEIKIIPKLFVNKRLAEEHIGKRLIQKAIWRVLRDEVNFTN